MCIPPYRPATLSSSLQSLGLCSLLAQPADQSRRVFYEYPGLQKRRVTIGVRLELAFKGASHLSKAVQIGQSDCLRGP